MGWAIGLRRRATLFGILMAAAALPVASRADADAPRAAAAAVHQFLEAYRAQDSAAILASIADDYDYSGVKKKDISPLGPFAILSDHFVYTIRQVLEVSPGVATALVDEAFTGRLNLTAAGGGTPTVVGTERGWIEVRQQKDGQWRVSALRPAHLHYTHPGSPSTFVTGVSANGASSIVAAPGAMVTVAGQTGFGLTQTVILGGALQSISLHLDQNAVAYEPWSAEIAAPAQPGRYYVDTFSFFFVPLADGRIALALDEVTVPVVVK
jgi:hypothetical protein